MQSKNSRKSLFEFWSMVLFVKVAEEAGKTKKRNKYRMLQVCMKPE